MTLSALVYEDTARVEGVEVGYFGGQGHEPPVLPGHFELRPIDDCLHAQLNTFQICVVSAAPETAAFFLEDAINLFEENCFLIVLCPELGLQKARTRFMDLGADDVVALGDNEGLAFALTKAERSVAQHRRLQDALRKSEECRADLQGALDSLPSPMFFKDHKGVYFGCNKAFARFLGLASEQIVGKTVHDVCAAARVPQHMDADLQLLSRGGAQIYDARVRDAYGTIRDVTIHKAVTRDRLTGEITGVVGAMLDVTERKALETDLKRMAERDELTGAYNRRKFFALAQETMKRREVTGRDLAVLVVDLDHFKQINDIHGHAGGDAALRHTVNLLREALPRHGIYARAGGEEFYCLLEGCEVSSATTVAEHVRRTVEERSFMFGGCEISLRTSVGVARVRDDESVSQAIVRADHVLYEAKKTGRNRVVVDPA